MNKVTFSQYIDDYQIVSVQNEDLLAVSYTHLTLPTKA